MISGFFLVFYMFRWPHWLNTANSYLGLAEIKGPRHNSVILKWLAKLGAWWRDDETPWCGVFVAAVMAESGLTYPRHYYRALAWAEWGAPMSGPAVGCVVVFTRMGGGHVGFVVGHDGDGRLMVLGGNQGDVVSIAPFDRSRVHAYRWPEAVAPQKAVLPLVNGRGVPSSKDES